MPDAPEVRSLLDLSGRVAIVTGASGNIGGGIARRLHEADACVIMHTRAAALDGGVLAHNTW